MNKTKCAICGQLYQLKDMIRIEGMAKYYYICKECEGK